MSTIKVTDIAYVRLRSPDLDEAEEFLTNFGMVRTARTAAALYMRGTDPQHHLHVTELGTPAFVGFAYHAASEGDLERVAHVEGASAIEEIDEPGGGKRVRLRDPHGFQIEIVHGMESVAPLPVQYNALNWSQEKGRKGDLCRLQRGPSQIKRIGHGVLMTTDLPGTLAWYRGTLGFMCSDDVYAGQSDNLIGSFNRCDRGEEFVDHHTLFALAGAKCGLNHISFEVQSIDDVMVGHEHLESIGKYKHVWGIGRHLLGSQIFDYWMDPWDRVHEHWTDSDLLNVHSGSNLIAVEEGLASQWGDRAPQEFVEHAVV
jgi:catechol 2,3-dioxygenase-like lactoylglutathione lyase family enzyme